MLQLLLAELASSLCHAGNEALVAVETVGASHDVVVLVAGRSGAEAASTERTRIDATVVGVVDVI